ncbi:MAG TPA: hypothetical protein VMJ34_23955 [Bryobacteraceae bacterium]|nr:hypothetical protein [Bryobacteraceae bacterium]
MHWKSLQILCLAAIMAVGLQAATNPVYWSTDPNLDCSKVYGPVPIDLGNGQTGYSCEVAGTFNWVAAGGGWGSEIRVSAPTTADIGADFFFYDQKGNVLDLDTDFGAGTAATDQTELTFSLFANEPVQVRLLGAHSNPTHSNTQTGSVWVSFYCPDQYTCLDVLPQLMYTNLTTVSWSLSVPVVWDDALWDTFSAVGIISASPFQDVSFALYNEDVEPSTAPTKTAFSILIYDSDGNLHDVGSTPPLLPIPEYSDGSYGEGETYGVGLASVVDIPSGPFKVLVDGAGIPSAVEFLQFNGSAAVTLQTAYDESTGNSVNAQAAVARKSGFGARLATGRPAGTRLAKPHSKARLHPVPAAPRAK